MAVGNATSPLKAHAMKLKWDTGHIRELNHLLFYHIKHNLIALLIRRDPQIRTVKEEIRTNLSAHPNDLIVNPYGATQTTGDCEDPLPNDLPTRFLV
jgi:hypothetical protein